MNGLYQSDLKFLLKYAKAVLVLLGKKTKQNKKPTVKLLELDLVI